MQNISLYFRAGSSNKEYHAAIIPSALTGAFDVTYRHGPRGCANTCGIKADALPLDKADKVFTALVKAKMAKGYVEDQSGAPYLGASGAEAVRGIAPMLLNAMSDTDLNEYALSHDRWILQEKMDGKRVMIHVDANGDVGARNRRGLPCGIPLAAADALSQFNLADSELDGELVGDTYYVFDVLKLRGRDMTTAPYSERLLAYVGIGASSIKPVPAIRYSDAASFHLTLASLKESGAEGVVLKDPLAPYTSGRPSSGGRALKYKFVESATCVVACVSATKRSVALSLLDESIGEFVEVGNVAVPANQQIPRVGDCVEIRYLYRFENGSLFQSVLLGLREDVLTEACTTSQVTRIKAAALDTDDE